MKVLSNMWSWKCSPLPTKESSIDVSFSYLFVINPLQTSLDAVIQGACHILQLLLPSPWGTVHWWYWSPLHYYGGSHLWDSLHYPFYSQYQGTSHLPPSPMVTIALTSLILTFQFVDFKLPAWKIHKVHYQVISTQGLWYGPYRPCIFSKCVVHHLIIDEWDNLHLLYKKPFMCT